MASQVDRLSFDQRHRVLSALIEIHGLTAALENQSRALTADGIEVSAGALRRYWSHVKRAIRDDPVNTHYDSVLAELVRQIIEEKRRG